MYKDCELIAEWVKSIINHLYWHAALAPDGDGKQMVIRWKSLLNHLCNEHDEHNEHDTTTFPLYEPFMQ